MTLTPRELELLTAYVDGTLSRSQYRQVKRLVRAKPTARRLLRSLLQDSRELQRLPAVPAPVDFAAAVLSQLEKQPLRCPRGFGKGQPLPAAPAAPAVLPPGASSLTAPVGWFWGYAAAAAVFLAVCAGSMLLHRPGATEPRVATRSTSGNNDSLVQERPEPAPEKPAPREADPLVREMPRVPRWLDFPPIVKVIPDDEPDESEEAPSRPLSPPNERPGAAVLASPPQELPHQLERVEFALPRVHVFHGLDVPEQHRALREQLTLASSYRVEIPARDGTRGLERLRQALAAQKVQWTVPAEVQLRLKRLLRSDYALFVENISPEELLEAFKQAGLADRAAAQKRPLELAFEGPLIVRETARVDRRELKDLLGIDPLRVRPMASMPPSVDIRKSLEESTGTTINETLQGRGIPRPGTTARLPSVGLVLALPLGRSKPPEVKKFLDSRPLPRAGTLQVLIVLRNLN